MERIVVGMSGGVDSSVAALLLKRQGYDVVGVFMKNWDEKDENGTCTAADDWNDVQSVCDTIGIPCYAVNFEKEYYDRVFSYFLDEYRRGRTPNPDVLCNREIKFRAFLDYALKLGASRMATGHFVQSEVRNGHPVLLKGADANKDQSYFLYMLKERQLARALFPVGGMTKAQVRAVAEENGLSTSKKKDSTGVCFIGERNFRRFLQGFLPMQPGQMRTPDGRVVGEHIGEDSPRLYSRFVRASGATWIAGDPPAPDGTPMRLTARFRYRQSDQAVTVVARGESLLIEADELQRAVTPGQSVVLYDGDVCLGGAVADAAGMTADI